MTLQINPKYLFWFCVFVFTVSFTAMMCLIYVDFPEKGREMASNTQGFLQGSLIMSAIGFLLTGSITGKMNDHKTTTEITPNSTIITTEPPLTETTVKTEG